MPFRQGKVIHVLRKLTIRCPPMGVNNTGWWWQFGADRLTEELPCRGEIEGVCDFEIIFPPCKVRRLKPGLWEVEAVVAKGYLGPGRFQGEEVRISYPAETVLREGMHMMAQPIDSIDGESWVVVNDLSLKGARLLGTKYKVRSKLPLARGVPVGLGLKRFVVDAVTLPGTVEWFE